MHAACYVCLHPNIVNKSVLYKKKKRKTVYDKGFSRNENRLWYQCKHVVCFHHKRTVTFLVSRRSSGLCLEVINQIVKWGRSVLVRYRHHALPEDDGR